MLDTLSILAKNNKVKQTKENKRNKLRSSGIQLYSGNELWKKSSKLQNS